MNIRRSVIFLSILAIVSLCGCGKPGLPIDSIRNQLRGVPTFSVVLNDMKEEGNFFKSFYHKYDIITEEDQMETDWTEVPKDYYRENVPFLGMTIWVKKDGKEGGGAGPPGYEYVGDSKYGRWERHSSGQSFWVFYGQYRLLSDLLGGGPIFRRNYDTYRDYRSKKRPYFGANREYGTNGSFTKRQKPDFYSRAMSNKLVRESSFSNRVKQRVGRTRTSARGRGTRVGK